MTTMHEDADLAARELMQVVTMHVDGQLVGLPIQHVQDVFAVQRVTPVPRAPGCVVGLVNLRGRVVTLLSLRSLLGLPDADVSGSVMAVGVEWKDEAFGLVIDKIGEVLSLDAAARDGGANRIDRRWSGIAAGIHKLDAGLLVELDLAALMQQPYQLAA
jgi:purine-binding chemotaxis protein CheW